MTEKPTSASEYTSEQSEAVRSICLYVTTKLGDLMDELVIVGGIVPSLIIDQEMHSSDGEAHVGTLDLDVGRQLGLLEDSRYLELTERLRGAGFSMDMNAAGNPTRQRWVLAGTKAVKVDFLISPMDRGDLPGRLKDIEQDFVAIITPGLPCAFRDREEVLLSGRTIRGGMAQRKVWVCGPGGFVVLKYLVFHSRGENKDAYDLYYVLRYYGDGVEDVASRLRPLCGDPEARKAPEILRRDFVDLDALGPMRVAGFLTGGVDEEIQADVALRAQTRVFT